MFFCWFFFPDFHSIITKTNCFCNCTSRWSEVFIIDPISPCMSLQFIDSPHVASILEQSQLIFISVSRSQLNFAKKSSNCSCFTLFAFKAFLSTHFRLTCHPLATPMLSALVRCTLTMDKLLLLFD